MDALRAVAEVYDRGVEGGPRIHGAHLEGPFVSPHMLEAQPPFNIEPTAELVAEAVATGCVRVVTITPELKHAPTALKAFAQAGVRVSLGHNYHQKFRRRRADDLSGLCRRWNRGGTHLFNAMSAIEGRRPGPVTALMYSDVAYGEISFDAHHVHPVSFRLAERVMRQRLLFVTDAMRGTGEVDGPSQLGGQDVRIRDGVVRLPDGTLAGSVLTLDQALRHALDAGMSLPKATRLVSTNAVAYLGLHDRGAIAPDLLADFTVLDDRFQVSEVWVNGEHRV